MDFAAIARTAIKVVAQPAEFFRGMPKKGGFAEPLVFMAAVAVLSGLLQALQGLLHLNMAGSAAAGLAAVVLIPILTVAFGFVGAAVMFLIWKLLGSREDYETAYRCVAYLSVLGPVATVLGVIPYLGPAASMAILTYYLVAASVEAHRIESKKAWTVFGAFGALLIVLSLAGQRSARRENGIPGRPEDMKRQVEEMQKQLEAISKQGKR